MNWVPAILLLLAASCVARAEVVVTAVEPDGRASALEAGDIIVGFRYDDSASGAIDTPLAFAEVASRYGWRGPTSLTIRRGDRQLGVELPPGDWGIAVRPVLPEADVDRYRKLVRALGSDEGALDDAREWRAQLVAEGRDATAAWWSQAVGEALLRQKRWDDARPWFVAPLGPASDRLPVTDRVSLLERHGTLALPGRAIADMRPSLERAIALQRSVAVDFRLAKLLVNVTTARGRSGDSAGADDANREARQLLQRLAPDSLVGGMALANAGTLELIAGEDDRAIPWIERAIAIYRHYGGPPDLLAGALTNRGILAYRRGNLSQAEHFYRESLEIARGSRPGTWSEALSLNNLSLVMRDRGHLRRARELLTEALAINRSLEPDSLSAARNMDNLAVLDVRLGDVRSARVWWRQTQSLFERLAPDGTELGYLHEAMGRAAEQAGDDAGADANYRDAAAQMRRVAPDSLVYADVLATYADFLLRHRQASDAAALVDEVLAIRTRRAPARLEFAEARVLEARLLIAGRRTAGAYDALVEAVRILRRESPDAAGLADALYELARLQLGDGRNGDARDSLTEAIAVLERQRRYLPGEDRLQRRFSDRYRHIYELAIRLQLEDGKPAAALETSERFRARSLRALLSEHDIAIDVPTDLARERQRLRQAYRLARQDHADASTRQELELQLAVLDDRIRSVAGQTQPDPDFELDRLRAALGEDTVALSYFVAGEDLLIFVVDGTRPVQVATVANGAATLTADVQRFRHLLSRGAYEAAPSDALTAASRRLYRTLIVPVRPWIADDRQLQVVADGVIHSVPFGALVTNASGAPRYLIEDRPLQFVQSLAIYDELARLPERPHELDMLAFADPGGADPAATRGANRNADLPGARREVAWLGTLFAGGRIETLTGAAATESSFLARAGSARYLHFATHATFDQRQPMDSYLSLAADPQSDGRLQVWEIFAGPRIAADVVTLAACDTASGQLVDSEGLLSIARAFEVAGARKVSAALWQVPDQTTAPLMSEFYQSLQSGDSAARALRRAQLRLLRGPTEMPPADDAPFLERLRRAVRGPRRVDARHPHYWAPFQVIGGPEIS